MSAHRDVTQDPASSYPPGWGESYDPNDGMMHLKGKDYLTVQARVRWFVSDQHKLVMAGLAKVPFVIRTELVDLDREAGWAHFLTYVRDVLGNEATMYGSESVRDFPDFAEKASCVPLRSRILTRRGFLRFDEVAIGEDVLAYDHTTDTTVWTPLREVKVYAEGDVVALTNGWGYRLECTKDHSWAVRYDTQDGATRYDYFRMRQAQHLKSCDRVVLAAPAPGGDSPITATEAAIIGWLFTDGTLKRREDDTVSAGVITQSKPAQIAVIRELVAGVAKLTISKPSVVRIAGNTRPSHCLPQHLFRLPAAYTRALFTKAGINTDADLPAFVTRLSVEAREAMFDAMMRADGTARGDFSKKRRPGTMEAWRVLCALRGVATGALHMRAHDMPVQRARKTRHMMASQLVVEPVGIRPVWCPTTDYGTWVMEQDGVVVITGNTKSVGRALACLGYGTAAARDLDEGERPADSPQPTRRAPERQVAPPKDKRDIWPTGDLFQRAVELGLVRTAAGWDALLTQVTGHAGNVTSEERDRIVAHVKALLKKREGQEVAS